MEILAPPGDQEVRLNFNLLLQNAAGRVVSNMSQQPSCRVR